MQIYFILLTDRLMYPYSFVAWPGNTVQKFCPFHYYWALANFDSLRYFQLLKLASCGSCRWYHFYPWLKDFKTCSRCSTLSLQAFDPPPSKFNRVYKRCSDELSLMNPFQIFQLCGSKGLKIFVLKSQITMKNHYSSVNFD